MSLGSQRKTKETSRQLSLLSYSVIICQFVNIYSLIYIFCSLYISL